MGNFKRSVSKVFQAIGQWFSCVPLGKPSYVSPDEVSYPEKQLKCQQPKMTRPLPPLPAAAIIVTIENDANVTRSSPIAKSINVTRSSPFEEESFFFGLFNLEEDESFFFGLFDLEEVLKPKEIIYESSLLAEIASIQISVIESSEFKEAPTKTFRRKKRNDPRRMTLRSEDTLVFPLSV